MGQRRNVALTLLALISLVNSLLLLAVLASLIRGDEKSGAQLLLKAMTVWGTNVITFGLWFWAFDRGGPVRRVEADPPPPDFQFPQMENPQLAEPGWYPRLLDYVYVSFTNSIAFSPTDAMPLTRRAKMLMLSGVGGLVGDDPARRRPRGQHLHLEHDRDRAVVVELDGHARAEHAGLDVDAELAERLAERLVERLGLLRRAASEKLGRCPSPSPRSA